MNQVLLIDENGLRVRRMQDVLRDHGIKATFVQWRSLAQASRDVSLLLRSSTPSRLHIVIVAADLADHEAATDTGMAGMEFARGLLLSEDSAPDVSVILTSAFDKTFLEAEGEVKFSEGGPLCYFPSPIDPPKLADRVRALLECATSSAELRDTARRFNAQKAYEIVRSAKHDARNAVFSVKVLLKQVASHQGSDEILERLVAQVRRDEGKERTWVRWFQEELASCRERLAAIGFDLDRDFPEHAGRMQDSVAFGEKYLGHFRLGCREFSLPPATIARIRTQAQEADAAFETVLDALESIHETIRRDYLS
jgi:hypothetical protein